MQLPCALFGLNPQNFLYFFLKRSALKKFLIFSQNFLMELSYVFLKEVFLIFRERYIQKPSIFSIVAYSEPGAYLEYCQTSTMEHKNSYLAHFLNPSSKNEKISYIFLYFGKWNFFLIL